VSSIAKPHESNSSILTLFNTRNNSEPIENRSEFALISAREDSESRIKEFGNMIFTSFRGYWAAGISFLLLFPVLDYFFYSNIYLGKINIVIVIIICYFNWCHPIKNSNATLLYNFLSILLIIVYLYVEIVMNYKYRKNPIDWSFFFINVSVSGLCCFLISLFYKLLPKFSKEGRKLKAAVEGLKLYINNAEKSTIGLFNPPKETPEVFEKLLPWAFAFGLTKLWVNRFEHVLEKTNYSPKWFSGDRYTLLYGNGINNLMTAVSEASIPKRSSTSDNRSRNGGFFGGGRER
jgi:hypothetical protein